MKKILLLQFRTDESTRQERASFERIARDDGSFTIDIVNVMNDEQPWDDPDKLLKPYDGVILGGSGEYHFTGHDSDDKSNNFSTMMQRVSPLLEHIIAIDFPTLGVCFGHQMIGHFLGVDVISDAEQAKAGSHNLCLQTPALDDPVFGNIPENFIAQYGHQDTLSQLPKDAILLANGTKCKYGAFRYKNNIYGVQFHPEMDRDDTINKMRLYPKYKKDDPHFEQNTKPSPHAPYVIRNFAKHARKK